MRVDRAELDALLRAAMRDCDRAHYRLTSMRVLSAADRELATEYVKRAADTLAAVVARL
jgi:hypothetical protein